MQIGVTLLHYRITARLGAGGMGEVYRAEDTRLKRDVALKLLPPDLATDPERRRRFEIEAQAVAALNHPNIVTIYSVEEAAIGGGAGEPIHFITMELIEGHSLDRVMGEDDLSIARFLQLALPLAAAVGAAHRRGITHRDLKPSNIMVTAADLAGSGESGTGRASVGRDADSAPIRGSRAETVKVLDFGLAKLHDDPDDVETEIETAYRTEAGKILGTASYMSPEQAEGKPVDERSDVFSLGIIFYEMIAGVRPFRGDTGATARVAIVRDDPAPLGNLRQDLPDEIRRLIDRCLEKNPDDRYPSAVELWDDLVAAQSSLVVADVGIGSVLARRRVVLPALVALLAIVLAGAWYWVQGSQVRWARNEAMPEIARLIDDADFVAAFRLAMEAERLIPGDPRLERMVTSMSSAPFDMRTDPEGAEVYVKDYLDTDDDWVFLGTSPLNQVRVPEAFLRWEIRKEGFEPLEAAAAWYGLPELKLLAPGEAPEGMVRVPAGTHQLASPSPISLDDYWIDKYEVSNSAFKDFVDAGGYENREHWIEPFVLDGRELTFEDAMLELRDITGRPGPATWELGTYADGAADLPVSGVSWYEATAYCRFAGKELPTIHHWQAAAGRTHMDIYSLALRLSNFSGEELAPVGRYKGLGPNGTYDMAGNVKEWVRNASGDSRFILGGAWDENDYVFLEHDAQVPFARLPNSGFRCARYTGAVSDQLTAAMERVEHDFSENQPVDDELFAVYESLFDYDPNELNATLDSVDESSEHFRVETVGYDAAYGGERMLARLYLPKSAEPPFQVVVFFPGADALQVPSSESSSAGRMMEFVPRSGRALMFPIYKGTYERRVENLRSGPNAVRDVVIWWSKDIGRSIDYLETRDDIDHQRLAYIGVSLGSEYAPIYLAVEERLKAAVLLAGGLDTHMLDEPSEVNPWNFAPRVTIPVLMVTGRHDFLFPYRTSQLPMFRLLGTPAEHKRHAVFDGGHVPPLNPAIRETLDWLDRYFGPVTMKR